ncbi:MAG: hypothetical protein PHH60_00065 [Candidatus Margulisbacteria bacterium]|nr:hypothetical protein [Candidatus Margulisiibacteriota bacterium]
MISIGPNPFQIRWGSMTEARPHLDAFTAGRLKKLLCDPHFDSTKLNLTLSQRIGRGKYYVDLELLLGDKLSSIEGISKSRLRLLYFEKMTPMIRQIYEDLVNSGRTEVYKRFWAGWQGQLNFVICLRYVLEQKYGIKMQRSPRTIDPRLFKRNQGDFLRGIIGKEDWTDFLAKSKLHGGFARTFVNSISSAMRMAYPWAFNFNTPEGAHLHLDDFRTNDLWQDSRGLQVAWRMVDHRVRKHLGIMMDERTQTFDPRLLRANQAEMLASLGQACWRDVFIAEGLGGLLASAPQFNNKVGQVLKWRYPWAFDRSKPEGEHLHAHDFEEKMVFTSGEELREALLHETDQEGWTLRELPQRINKEWLKDHGLGSISEVPKIEIFRQAFPIEFSSGFFTEADFRNQGTMRRLKPSAYRMIKPSRVKETTYGIIIANKTAYYFPAEYLGCAARLESAEHGVVYKMKTVVRSGKTGRSLVPIKAFRLPQDSRTYWKPELVDYDPAEFPILSKKTREGLVALGTAPQGLTISEQQQLLKAGRPRSFARQ